MNGTLVGQRPLERKCRPLVARLRSAALPGTRRHALDEEAASEIERLRTALADVVDTDWTFIGKDSDTGNPDSLYSRVRRGRLALGPNVRAERPQTAAPQPE